MAYFIFWGASGFNVLDYGAIGDGKTDDSPAFLRAWKAACKADEAEAPSNSNTVPSLIVPAEKTFLLMPVTFTGPCTPNGINFRILGSIVAPDQPSAWEGHHINTWLVFSNVNGLVVNGGGQIDGQGSSWWSRNCSVAKKGGGCIGPTALQFLRCNSLQLSSLRHINSQRNHMTLTSCNDAVISNLDIIAPGKSPNTDGIDIENSGNIQILDSSIGTGDDCIAIGGGSYNVKISGISCGPGHGISIGALGRGGFDSVENVSVQNSTLTGTTNGVRIKTWQGGSGHARNISYQRIKLVAVNNSIIIDQFYCPTHMDCENKTAAVEVSNVTYTEIYGTSPMDKAISLGCSQALGCTNIVFHDVRITSTRPGGKPYAYCNNAHGWATNTEPDVGCLSQSTELS